MNSSLCTTLSRSVNEHRPALAEAPSLPNVFTEDAEESMPAEELFK